MVKKALIPAAGLGTRFLPATKTIPKEMLPIVDAPIILFVVEEAVRAGIEDIILVAGRGKTAIEDFFDISHELESKLEDQGRSELLSRVRYVRDHSNIISIRQKQALGLGHAVLAGKPAIGKEPFAVLLGDEIMLSSQIEKTVTAQLVNSYAEQGLSTVAVMDVPSSAVHKYGIVGEGERLNNEVFRVNQVIEKPSPETAPSRWALPGRYVFAPRIFDYLADTKPGVGGEIQLTDAMTQLANKEGLLASRFQAQRYDAGDKLGYLQANIEVALMDEKLGPELKNYIGQLAQKF